MKSQTTKDWSDTVKNYCQVAAIMVAGWWTYTSFIQKDAPGLEARGNATNNIYWNHVIGTKDNWEVEFGVSLENKGTTAFDISKIRVRAWEFDFRLPAERRLPFFDWKKIQSGQTFYDETFLLDPKSVLPFSAHYPPGTINVNSFVWLITLDCSKRLYFLAEFYKKGKEDAPNWSTYWWGQECSEEDNRMQAAR